MNIAAFDLSLTGTGFARAEGDKTSFDTLRPPKGVANGMARLHWILRSVYSRAETADLVVFEGLSYGSNDPSAQERSGLAYLIRYELWYNQRPFILVPPSTLKKFVTGKGNAEKSIVIREVFRRYGCECGNDNEADACGLAVIGKCLAGDLEPETEWQRVVIAKLRPEYERAMTERTAEIKQ